MIAILLVGILACASAAPRWGERYSDLSPFDGSLDRYINQEIFDTNRFFDEMTRDLNREMAQLETMLRDFGKHFPSVASTEGVEGNDYKIAIPLTGFDEKDIVVKARKGMLMIQAVHTDGNNNHNNYLDVRTLPVCVGEQGSWSYENNVLRITLPIARNDDEGAKELPSVPATPEPDRSREETESPLGKDDDLNMDIDLVGRGDQGKEKEIKTNEIPSVEATTYAVDVKGDYEFVPVKY